jgi:hypothetical protein
VTDAPEEVRRLAEARHRARRGRDFATADGLRDRIRQAGFDVIDRADGWDLRPAGSAAQEETGTEAAGVAARPEEIESALDAPPVFEFSLQWVVEGWPEDVVRGINSFRRHQGGCSVQYVVVDTTLTEADDWPDDVDLVRLAPGTGWAAARNAGLRRTSAGIVVIVDGSIEADGDAFEPLAVALQDPSIGVTGPFGIVTDDLREFREAEGMECDAVEGYLMAFRRDLLLDELRFDPKFRFYRSADIELSFQIKARGLRATVTPLPVKRYEHRMWVNTPIEERARLSKRNYYRFLDRWRGRTDLLVTREVGGDA